MKILLINHHRWSRTAPRAGAFASRLVERGHEVTLMVVADHGRWNFSSHDWNGVRVIESPDLLWGRMRSGWDPMCALRRISWLKKNSLDFDLIHLYETRPATIYPGLYLKKQLGVPLVIDWIDWWGRGGLISVNRPYLYRVLFGACETYFEERFRGFADATTVISNGLAARAAGLGVESNTITHLRPGVDLERFKLRSIDDSRKILGLPKGGYIIGFVSQDSFLDLGPFIEGVSNLIRSGVDAKILLLGTVKTETKELIKKYELGPSVILPGFVSDGEYPIYLAACNVFGMPFPETNYNIGRWPNKFGEYLASGRPIVFNPEGDLHEFTIGNQPGIACEFSSDSFTSALRLLYESPELSERLGSSAREIAETKFSWSSSIDKLEYVYKNALIKKGGDKGDEVRL